jgi:predicted acylesterase/phospholipase RssA
VGSIARKRGASSWTSRCWTRGLVLSAVALICAGCTASIIREAVPEHLASDARVAGMRNIRAWGDEAGGTLRAFLAEEAPRMRARLARMPQDQTLHHHILALSGGADDGAFGAGLLTGWTARGNRPQFSVVTGVSAGALIAPFAFLGSEYDPQLEAMFKNYSGRDIYQAHILSGLLGGSALADSGPLAALIAQYVDDRMVARLAHERANGRVLIIGTTNLDAQRPVYWDIGKIAQSGGPEAATLIHNVLLASASIPGLFPPVNVRVAAGDGSFEEMHVDGGPTRQLFLAPLDFSFREFDRAVGRKINRTLWVIRNGKLSPEYKAVPSGTFAISLRAIETLTKYQSLGDLGRMYFNARADGMDFNLISVPHAFTAPRPQPFDHAYMEALFDTGFSMAKSGIPWAKAPPGVLGSSGRRS